jgi:hypothetical protein
MRNYEYTLESLSNEISKQFNITKERAKEEVINVAEKYPNLKKSRKVLKKMENLPKYKLPGIGIDIQGKQRENYKIRINGARNKEQLNKMIEFMNILIYLYIETYLYKKPERQILKKKLETLTNIAKRRNKVDDIVKFDTEIKTVKKMIQKDKKRIGFKPEKGQNQWTRCCQNSGKDKRRQPQSFFTNDNESMNKLIKQGYKFNKKSGVYERRVLIKNKKTKKKEQITLSTIRIKQLDEENKNVGNDIYYACNPEDNGEHMYVGFLTRCINPHGQCMPCCFKKDPSVTKNKKKKEFYNKCIQQALGIELKKDSKEVIETSKGEKLYILQDTNKIQEGRFSFLPLYLDFYLNIILNNSKKIKNNYLVTTDSYYFKYGSIQKEYQFLNAISSIFDMNIDDIKNNIIKILENDTNEQIFISLNEGDIKTSFKTIDEYINFIKTSSYLDYQVMYSILSIPNVLTDKKLNILIFDKKVSIIKSELEKDKIKEDYLLICDGVKNLDSLINSDNNTIFILKDGKNYYPIIKVIKKNSNTKDIEEVKIFKYQEEKDNIIYHIKDFYIKNCETSIINNKSKNNAINLYNILNNIKDNNYLPRYQVIDNRNKCKYIITKNNLILPVSPSGSIYNLKIVKSIDNYIKTFDETITLLNELIKKDNTKILLKPKGVYFDKKKDNKYNIIGIYFDLYNSIPIINEYKTKEELQKYNLVIENKSLYDKIDEEILKEDKKKVIDNRITEVNYNKYFIESYQLFRLEFSDYINRKDYIIIRSKIEKIMTNIKLIRKDKLNKIKLLVYRIVDKNLYNLYKKLLGEKSNIDDDLDDEKEYIINRIKNKDNKIQTGGKYDKFIHIINKIPKLIDYEIKNNRNICKIHDNKETCNSNIHCRWAYSECYLSITLPIVIEFINKISEELVSGNLKAFEIMKIGEYFVSDIVDYNKFTNRPNQKIIKSNSNTINKTLKNLFGKDNIPIIGKRKISKTKDKDYEQLNIENPLKNISGLYIQTIIENNLSIIRSYVNGYYWIKNIYYDNENRNLGYYNSIQTDLTNYFKSKIIDWLQNKNNKNDILSNMNKYLDDNNINSFIVKLGSNNELTNGIIELYILNKIHKIPILVINNNNNIIYIFDNGIDNNIKNIDNNKYLYNDKYIKIRFHYIKNNPYPYKIDSIYNKN